MIRVAEEAAKRAGEVLRQYFGRASLEVTEKGPGDFVTEADLRAEEVIRKLLESEAPEHDILLEESGAVGPGSDYQWVVDPLDGTTNFIHRFPFFCVSIGLRYKGKPIVGVVYDPMTGDLFLGEVGEGARLNGVGINVSKTEEMRSALVGIGPPPRLGPHREAASALADHLASTAVAARRTGSAALELAYLSIGRLDGFCQLGLKPWDLCAGAVLISEAGGRLTDFDGGDGAIDGGDVIASNGCLHEAILADTKRFFPHRPAG